MDLSRMQLMLGTAAIERLAQAHVAVFGLGELALLQRKL